jgi:ribose 5-phosphate isomerase B
LQLGTILVEVRKWVAKIRSRPVKIAVASDEKTFLTDFVIEDLKRRGHQVQTYGPLANDDLPWTLASEKLADAVANGEADEGVLFCYTGTGASIAANKVPDIRAALCGDAQTARGARWWNDANVLVLSLRATSPEVAAEILEAWFSESVRPDEVATITQLKDIETRHAQK